MVSGDSGAVRMAAVGGLGVAGPGRSTCEGFGGSGGAGAGSGGAGGGGAGL